MSNSKLVVTKKMSQDSTDSTPVRRQAILNAANPMTGRVHELSVDSNESARQINNRPVDVDEEEEEVVQVSGPAIHSSLLRAILLGALKSKKILAGSNFLEVLAHTKKNLNKLSPNKLTTMNEKKNAISKLCLQGIRSPDLARFLLMKHVILKLGVDYVDAATSVCMEIYSILEQECLMTDLDFGVLMDYFNAKFSDIRNQENSKRKPRVKKQETASKPAKSPTKATKISKKQETTALIEGEAPERKRKNEESLENEVPKKSKAGSRAPRKCMPTRVKNPPPLISDEDSDSSNEGEGDEESGSEEDSSGDSSDESEEESKTKSAVNGPKEVEGIPQSRLRSSSYLFSQVDNEESPAKKKQTRGKKGAAEAREEGSQVACSSVVSTFSFKNHVFFM